MENKKVPLMAKTTKLLKVALSNLMGHKHLLLVLIYSL